MKTLLWIAGVMLLAGCASYSGRGLAPGRSSAEEVEALMGPAAERRAGAAGESVLYYSRLPEGGQTYAARIGPDGMLVALEQRLAPEYIAKIAPGRSRAEDVRDLLGPPWSTDRLPRLMRDVWSYPMLGSPYRKVLYIQFSGDGVVREVIVMNDPWRERTLGLYR